jgi:DNA-binding NarL/FixJ family response regulator
VCRIARLLSISPRTVDNHLGRTYAKLGIASRADLPAVFDSRTGHSGEDET